MSETDISMRIGILTGAVLMAVAMPLAAYAQGGGVAAGAAVGATGGVTVVAPAGASVTIITDANTPKFREFIVKEHHPSYAYKGELVIGAELPATGVTYYEVPREYGMTEFRYTIVNDRAVLVDVKTHKIVQIIG